MKKKLIVLVAGLLFLPSLIFAQTELSLSELQAEFTGENSYDYAGYSVSSAGDVNNDGYDDILVSAIYNDNAGSSAGAVYLIYGQNSALSNASLSTVVQFTGETAGDQIGGSVSSAGDVNGDGFDDILVGAPSNDDNGSYAGAVYLIYGQATALSSASLSTAVQFTGEAAGDNAGRSVSSAGDVNGDGFDDILIGARSNDDNGSSAGAVYLIYGQATALSSASLSTAVQFTGEAAGDNAGRSVSSAGDVNGDGFDDILIGARSNDDNGSSAGAVYLIYGQATALSSASLSTAVQFTGEAAGDHAGGSVSSAGDVNNDGYNDVLIGAYGDDDGENVTGLAYIIYGSSSLSDSIDLSVADVKFIGEEAGDRAGYSVSSSGDVNGDGMSDILIGAYSNDDAGSAAGAAYLGYLYIDLDGDGLAGDTGLFAGTDTNDNDYDNDGVETEDDCNDEDDSISENQSYYVDSDEDGYGSTATASVCSLTATAGYSTNNTDCNDSDSTVYENQTYYQDLDGDGLGSSDVTTSVCSFTTPDDYTDNANDPDDTLAQNSTYYNYDPADNTLDELAISNVEGTTDGDYIVTYTDSSEYTFSAFDVTTTKTTKIKQYRSKGYFIALNPNGKNIAIVNPYNGNVLKKNKIAKTNFKYTNLKVLELRGKYFAVVTLKNKNNKVKLVITRILIKSEKFGKEDATKLFKAKNLKVTKTKKLKKNYIQLKSSKKVIRKYFLTKKYNLKRK